MTNRIPPAIKTRVLEMWLFGIPRDEISKSVGIGQGSVSRIIALFKSTDVPDLDLLRNMAVKIKHEELNLADVASYTRLSNFLEQMGSSESEMETLLQEIEVYCFKIDKTFHDFVAGVHDIHEFASELGISIYKIPDYVADKKQELQTLDNEMNRLKILNQQKVE